MSRRRFGGGGGRLSLAPLVGSATDQEIAARVGRTDRQVAEVRRRGLDLFEADEWAAHYDLHPASVWGVDWETAVNSDPIVESVAVPKSDASVFQVWQRRKRGAPGVQTAFPAWDGTITAETNGRPMSGAELAEIGLDRVEVQEGKQELIMRLIRQTPLVLQEESGRTWVMEPDGNMWLVSGYFRGTNGVPGVWLAGREGRFRVFFEDGTVGDAADSDAIVEMLGEMSDHAGGNAG